MIAVGGSPEANRSVMDIARANPLRIRAAIGINRDLAGFPGTEPGLEELLAAPEVVAVGEVGLDFRHADTNREAQIRLFDHMLDIARRQRLPVIVHSRAADAETIAALEKHARNWAGVKGRIGVQHCFTGSRAFAERLLALGFLISFSGIITFKNAAELREIAAEIPEDRILIETDSPWLAPEPFRGKPNEPANVRRVAETLAEIRQTTTEAIADATFRNAEKLFGIGSLTHGTHGAE